MLTALAVQAQAGVPETPWRALVFEPGPVIGDQLQALAHVSQQVEATGDTVVHGHAKLLVTLVIVGLLAMFSAACLGFVLWITGRREESASVEKE
jgi:hypothetical protein